MTDRLDAISLLNGIPVSVALLDSQMRIVAINAAMEPLTGFSLEEAQGVPWQFIIRSGLSPKDCPAAATLKDGKKRGAQTDIISKDREKIPVMLTVAAIPAGSGGRPVLTVTVEDISLFQDIKKSLFFEAFEEFIGHSLQIQKIK